MISDVIKNYKFWIPMILGYATSKKCPVGSSAGAKINARPPAFVFGIVWPILYMCLGYVWTVTKNSDKLFFINTLLGSLWIYFFGCLKNKKYALYTILFMLLCAFAIYTFCLQSDNKITPYLILPYIIWLMFALLLNFKEVNDNNKELS